MKANEFMICKNANLKTDGVYKWTKLLLGLLLFAINNQPVFCQTPEEAYIPIMIERSIKEDFQYTFLEHRLNDERNLKFRWSLNSEYYFSSIGNYHALSMNIKPIDHLFGVPLKNTCVIEVVKPYTFMSGISKIDKTYYLNDSLFPYGDKFLVHYEVTDHYYPFPVDLQYISGNINTEGSPYYWIDELLGEEATDLRFNPDAAELYLKFRLFSYNASKPKLNRKFTNNQRLDYWSFSIKEIDITQGRPCEARVYKGYNHHQYVIDLIYYVDGLPDDLARLSSYTEGVYKVTWRISTRFREHFYPKYTLLSKAEKKKLIAKGKFYPFFHKQQKSK